MTEDQIKAAIANTIESAIWEQSDEGTFKYGANHQAIVQDMAAASAAAVMALVGPKPLVWPKEASNTGIYKTRMINGTYYSMKIFATDRVVWRVNTRVGWNDADSEPAAQAAAQAHADAAHWGRMALADIITPKGET